MSSAQQGPPAGGGQEYGGTRTSGGEQTGTPATGYARGETEARHAARGPSVAVWSGAILAGVLMMISGLYSFLTGLAVILHNGYVHVAGNYAYAWSNRGWGWVDLILGIVVFAAGVSVMLGMLWARIVGIILASLSAIANFMFIPFQPFFSIVLIAVDIYIIWALAGMRRDTAAYY
jgi:hypothetical protein